MDSRSAIRERRRGKKICPESRTVIVDVYCFLKKEYERMVVHHEACCDISHLSNIEQRTAAATGVSIKTLKNLIRQERLDRMKNLTNDAAAGATSESIQNVQEIAKGARRGKSLEGIKVKPLVKPTTKSTIQPTMQSAKNTSIDANRQTIDEMLRSAGNTLNDFYLTSDSDSD